MSVEKDKDRKKQDKKIRSKPESEDKKIRSKPESEDKTIRSTILKIRLTTAAAIILHRQTQ